MRRTFGSLHLQRVCRRTLPLGRDVTIRVKVGYIESMEREDVWQPEPAACLQMHLALFRQTLCVIITLIKGK